MIKSVYASLDYLKEVFSIIDNMLNDNAVIEVVMEGRPYYLHREGEELTHNLKKNALCIDIEELLSSN